MGKSSLYQTAKQRAKQSASSAARHAGRAGRQVHSRASHAVRHSWTKIQQAGLSFWIFVLFLFVFVGTFFFDVAGFLTGIVERFGLIAIFLISFVVDFLVQPIGPDLPLIAGILLEIPWWHALLATICGSTLAVVGTYLVGRYIGEPGMQRILGPKRTKKLQEKKNYGKWALFLGALTPVPFIPYLAGVYHFTVWQTFLYIVLPRSIRFTVVAIVTLYVGPLAFTYFGGL